MEDEGDPNPTSILYGRLFLLTTKKLDTKVEDNDWVRCAIFMLGDDACIWWEIASQGHDLNNMTWDAFRTLFYEKYYNEYIRAAKGEEFIRLTQGNMTMTEYATKFDRLAKFASDEVATEVARKAKFIRGLDEHIAGDVIVASKQPGVARTYAQIVEQALVSEDTEETHESHLRMVLQRLREHKLHAKFRKCEFWLPQVSFLRHVVSKDGYYRRFVEGFAKISTPLTELTQQNCKFVWTADALSRKGLGQVCELKKTLTKLAEDMTRAGIEFVIGKLANITLQSDLLERIRVAQQSDSELQGIRRS
ncbi:uncharacterized protein LOC133034558 [Cannabis sativa]|uniref:uncharacterized protein LOC133034558 n=1 Tax=Cannabis sativa TaxID=3483 RepID=UPI0029CA4340|nr:uncharacterized protein LOC133034558 [Cannabis sativa]